MSINWLFILLTFFAINGASIALATIGGASGDPESLIFVYKYFLIIILPMLMLSLLKNSFRIKIFEIMSLVSFVSLIIWSYYYVLAVEAGTIFGVSRVSFPGSDTFLRADAHLYSNYLAMSLLFYFLYLRHSFGHNFLFSILLIGFGFGAMVLTGSRNGILVFSLGILLWYFLTATSGRINISVRSGLRLSAFLICLALGFFFLFEEMVDFFSSAAERAFLFQFSGDESSEARIVQLSIAIDDWLSSSVLFGASILGASFRWYDTGLGILLVHFGLVGFIFLSLLMFLAIKVLTRDLSSPLSRVSLVLLLVYCFSNLITEFALVTRSLLPVVAYICIPIAKRHMESGERQR